MNRPALSLCVITPGPAAYLFGNFSLARRRQFYPGATGFGQADGNGLFCRMRTVFSFANVMKFFPHEFTGLG